MVLKSKDVSVGVGLAGRSGLVELSVTEVRNALRCPRVFALGRAHRQAVVFPIGSSSLGPLFHRIVERYARESELLPEPIRGSTERTPRERVADSLLRYLVAELEAIPEAAMMPGELDDLAEALRELAGSLAPSPQGTERTPAGALRSFRERAGRDLVADFEGPGGESTRLVGRTEELVGSGEGGLCLVEFKLADEAYQELDRAQIALYRALMQRALDVDFVPELSRCTPKLLSTKLSPPEADALVERRILPFLGQMAGWSERPETAPPTARRDLCPTCPVRAACVERYPERLEVRDSTLAGAARPVPDLEGKLVISPVVEPAETMFYDMAGKAESDELGTRVLAELKRRKIYITIKGTPFGARLACIEVHCSRQRVALLDRAAEDVEHQLSNDEVRFERKGPKRFFSAPRKTPRPVELATLLARKADYLRERPGRFVVGEGMDGDAIAGDLSDGSCCHLLIGGQTGSGKSVLLRTLISSLCHFHPPSAIRFTLVDPKRVTFGAFAASIAAHLTGPIFYDPEALLPALDDLVAEMESRYERMERCRAQNIDDYNALGGEQLARLVVVVDEFQDLIAAKALRQPFLDAVKRLGAKARAAGIHLILATQRPDKNTVPGEIKANLCGRIALRVQEAINSRIILDQGGAEALLGRGDLLANLGHGVVRAQAPKG